MPAFDTRDDLNAYLRGWCHGVADQCLLRELGETVTDRLARKRTHLAELPHDRFDTAWHGNRVSFAVR